MRLSRHHQAVRLNVQPVAQHGAPGGYVQGLIARVVTQVYCAIGVIGLHQTAREAECLNVGDLSGKRELVKR
jgi:hypothetical protein